MELSVSLIVYFNLHSATININNITLAPKNVTLKGREYDILYWNDNPEREVLLSSLCLLGVLCLDV
jgi:hypothetical protein